MKLLVHCKEDFRDEFFQDIKDLFKNKGNGFDSFFKYFQKTWLQLNKNFLDGLIKAYTEQPEDISFIRTNNPCELYNKYLGISIFLLFSLIFRTSL